MIVPQRFRKRPVVIEALYLGRHNASDVAIWVNSNGGNAAMRGGPKGGSFDASVGIETLEGRIWYEPGWWVIRGVQGEFYACRADIFDRTYEAAE